MRKIREKFVLESTSSNSEQKSIVFEMPVNTVVIRGTHFTDTRRARLYEVTELRPLTVGEIQVSPGMLPVSHQIKVREISHSSK